MVPRLQGAAAARHSRCPPPYRCVPYPRHPHERIAEALRRGPRFSVNGVASDSWWAYPSNDVMALSNEIQRSEGGLFIHSPAGSGTSGLAYCVFRMLRGLTFQRQRLRVALIRCGKSVEHAEYTDGGIYGWQQDYPVAMITKRDVTQTIFIFDECHLLPDGGGAPPPAVFQHIQHGACYVLMFGSLSPKLPSTSAMPTGCVVACPSCGLPAQVSNVAVMKLGFSEADVVRLCNEVLLPALSGGDHDHGGDDDAAAVKEFAKNLWGVFGGNRLDTLSVVKFIAKQAPEQEAAAAADGKPTSLYHRVSEGLQRYLAAPTDEPRTR